MICLRCQFNTDPSVLCAECKPVPEDLCKRCNRITRYTIKLLDGTFRQSQLCYWCIRASVTLHTVKRSK